MLFLGATACRIQPHNHLQLSSFFASFIPIPSPTATILFTRSIYGHRESTYRSHLVATYHFPSATQQWHVPTPLLFHVRIAKSFSPSSFSFSDSQLLFLVCSFDPVRYQTAGQSPLDGRYSWSRGKVGRLLYCTIYIGYLHKQHIRIIRPNTIKKTPFFIADSRTGINVKWAQKGPILTPTMPRNFFQFTASETRFVFL